jgi:hypothetical protein
MFKCKFKFGLSNGFCTMGDAISGEKKELLCQVTRNMGKLPGNNWDDAEISLLQRCIKRMIKTQIPDDTDPQYPKRVYELQVFAW